LSSFGNKGKGPNEFIAPSLLKGAINNGKDSQRLIFIHDFKRNKISRIDIDQILKDEKDFELISIPETDNYLPFMHYFGNNYLIGTPSRKGIITIIDSVNNKSITIPYLPKLDFDIPEHSFSVIYRPAVIVNNEETKVAVASLYLGELNYFGLDGNLLNTVVFESRDEYKNELIKGAGAFSEIKEQIIELNAGDNYIFALNSNTAVKDFKSDERKAKIQVFDWGGNALMEFKLDQRHISSIGIDTTHKRIYGFDRSAKTKNIVYYNYLVKEFY
jgi:hypothetical protein